MARTAARDGGASDNGDVGLEQLHEAMSGGAREIHVVLAQCDIMTRFVTFVVAIRSFECRPLTRFDVLPPVLLEQGVGGFQGNGRCDHVI